MGWGTYSVTITNYKQIPENREARPDERRTPSARSQIALYRLGAQHYKRAVANIQRASETRIMRPELWHDILKAVSFWGAHGYSILYIRPPLRKKPGNVYTNYNVAIKNVRTSIYELQFPVSIGNRKS